MNLPNKLTVLRLIMTPFFLLALLVEFPHHMLVALILFAAASITDYIDGNMARKHNLVTDFGKFLDPLADKMLTTAAFLGFIQLGIGVGISSGANFIGSVMALLESDTDATCVTVFADDNKKYLSTDYAKTFEPKDEYISSHIKLTGVRTVR